MVFEPSGGLFACVLGVIILLKGNVILGFVVKLDTFLEFFIQNLDVKVSIHPPIHPASILYPTPSHIIQPHTITDPPPNFFVPSTCLSLKPSPAFFHTHFCPSDHTNLFQSS